MALITGFNPVAHWLYHSLSRHILLSAFVKGDVMLMSFHEYSPKKFFHDISWHRFLLTLTLVMLVTLHLLYFFIYDPRQWLVVFFAHNCVCGGKMFMLVLDSKEVKLCGREKNLYKTRLSVLLPRKCSLTGENTTDAFAFGVYLVPYKYFL